MPEPELADQAGRPWRLVDALAGGAVVLVFFRGDWWPYCNGQLVELADQYGDFRAAGAEVAGISVDSPGAHAGLTEKLALPFPLLSDPDGERAIRRFGVWDETRPIARSAAVVLAPDGTEAWRFEGVDYLDRPPAGDVLAAVRALGLPPRPPAEGAYPHLEPEPSDGAETRAQLKIYFRGVRGAANALKDRTGSPDADRVWAMASRYFELFSR